MKNFTDNLKEKSRKIKKNIPLKKCPNCKKTFNGRECYECGFDAYCFNSIWD